MKIEQLLKSIKDVLGNEKDIISSGYVSEEILKEVENALSSYRYIEIIKMHYTDPERPYYNNWTDVEGFGYGWEWLREEDNKSKWHGILSEVVIREIFLVRENSDISYFFKMKKDRDENEVEVYQFNYLRNNNLSELIITLSNNELFY